MKKTTTNGSRTRKLLVDRETIAALTSPRLDRVAGGAGEDVPEDCSAYSSCNTRTVLVPETE